MSSDVNSGDDHAFYFYMGILIERLYFDRYVSVTMIL